MIDPITPSTFSQMVERWSACLKNREVGCIVSVSKSMMIWRLDQLRQDGRLGEIAILDLDSEPIEDIDDLESRVQRVSIGNAVFFLGCDQLLQYHNVELLSALDNLSHQRPFFWVLTSNPFATKWVSFWSAYPALIQNILYQPLYQQSDSKQFINYLSQKWSLTISARDTQDILKYCGGALWLIKQAVRLIRDNGQLPPDWKETTQLQARIQSIWSNFSPPQQQLLKMVVNHQQIIVNPETTFLVNMGWIQKNNQTYKISVPLLEMYINHFATPVRIDFPSLIDTSFSKQEQKVIKLLIASPGKIISREDVAQALWSETWENSYSDWTIDQNISRIRKKLSRLGILRTSLKTIKGRGFVWEN